jgi:hypothetical protein
VLDQLGDAAVDQTMVVAVEIRLDDQVGNLVPRAVFQQQPAQQRLLRLHRVRRQLDRLHLRVGHECCDILSHGIHEKNSWESCIILPPATLSAGIKKGLLPALFHSGEGRV